MTGSVDHPSLSRSCSCRRIQLPQGRSTRLARAVVVRREPAFEVGCSGPGEWPLVFWRPQERSDRRRFACALSQFVLRTEMPKARRCRARLGRLVTNRTLPLNNPSRAGRTVVFWSRIVMLVISTWSTFVYTDDCHCKVSRPSIEERILRQGQKLKVNSLLRQ